MNAAAQPKGSAQAGMQPEEHQAIWDLLDHHDSIVRSIEELPDGVRAKTTTSRPELVATLRTHVRQMAQHIEKGQPVRMWDPVYKDVFDHAKDIKLNIQDVEGGVVVTETTTNPAVIPIIRAHARKVSALAEQGHAAARPPWAGGRR